MTTDENPSYPSEILLDPENILEHRKITALFEEMTGIDNTIANLAKMSGKYHRKVWRKIHTTFPSLSKIPADLKFSNINRPKIEIKLWSQTFNEETKVAMDELQDRLLLDVQVSELKEEIRELNERVAAITPDD